MLLLIAGILIVLWLFGLVAHLAGAFIHILLIVAAVVFIVHLLRGHRAV